MIKLKYPIVLVTITVARVNWHCVLTRELEAERSCVPVPQPHMRICISSVINTTLYARVLCLR